jgi:hypothetical protein
LNLLGLPRADLDSVAHGRTSKRRCWASRERNLRLVADHA